MSEHSKRFRFLEYALALQEMLREFPDIRRYDEDMADFLLYLGLPYIRGQTNLPKSVVGTYTWRILSEELGLEQSFDVLEKPMIDSVDAKTDSFLNIPQGDFDGFDYRAKVHTVTKSIKRRIMKDFEGKKIIAWVVTTIIAVVGTISAVATFILKNKS